MGNSSTFVKFRFEIITTCCATIFGALFFGVTWWFSGMGKWVVEASFGGAILLCLCAVTFHALVHELDKMAEERHRELQKKRDRL